MEIKEEEDIKRAIETLIKYTYKEKSVYEKVSKMIDNLVTLLNHEIEDETVNNLREKTKEALLALLNLEQTEESLEKSLLKKKNLKKLSEDILKIIKEEYNINEEEIKKLKELEKYIDLSDKTTEEKKKDIIRTIAFLNKHIKDLIEEEEKKLSKAA